jgi:hypothetical protein
MKGLLIATTQAKHDMDRLTMWPLPVGLTSLTAHRNVVRHPLQSLDMTFSTHAYLERHRVYTTTARSAWAVAA